MRITGTSSSSPRYSNAPVLSGCLISFRTGFPVYAVFPFGKYSTASLYEIATRCANFPAHAFTRPGVLSDSWTITGIPRIRAAINAGKLVYPPFAKTTSGKSE